ncbi:MAG: Secretory immunoglobulin A-binding protein EsiB [Verrucomicrobia subdivision 3 bacterium]|nr:Secretory immunoglobulin A-binding protein EsiB [Limisphaerales bacterium]MCS1413055.1 Secretory immunoglobulin A-binding protein EsiB [Limisphaerales bacterium]
MKESFIFNIGIHSSALAGLFFLTTAAFAAVDIEALRQAAEAGNAPAQSNLAAFYVLGAGVPKNDAEAVKWYRKAADQGDAGAQFFLGYLYASGLGVPKNYAEAVRWYRKAADQGDARAQSGLGEAYYNGAGVLKNDAEAAKWYRKAANQREPSAQYNLGFLYLYGRGVPENKVESYAWILLAKTQAQANAQAIGEDLIEQLVQGGRQEAGWQSGLELITEAIEILEEEWLSSAQRAQGQQRALELQRGFPKPGIRGITVSEGAVEVEFEGTLYWSSEAEGPYSLVPGASGPSAGFAAVGSACFFRAE